MRMSDGKRNHGILYRVCFVSRDSPVFGSRVLEDGYLEGVGFLPPGHRGSEIYGDALNA